MSKLSETYVIKPRIDNVPYSLAISRRCCKGSIVVLTLLLLSILIVACGPDTSSAGAQTPATNTPTTTTAEANTPGSTKVSATATTGSTSDHPSNPAPDTYKSKTFTATEQNFLLTDTVDGTNPSSRTFTVNSGDPTPIDWSASITPDVAKSWIKLDPDHGQLGAASDPNQPVNSPTITVTDTNSSAHLSPGCYKAAIEFTPVNPNHDNTIKVYLAIDTTVPGQEPEVSSLSSASGSVNGSTSVTITGSGFRCATSVKFGLTLATDFKIVNDSQIVVSSPPGQGTVDVTVTIPNTQSRLNAPNDQFTYTS